MSASTVPSGGTIKHRILDRFIDRQLGHDVAEIRAEERVEPGEEADGEGGAGVHRGPSSAAEATSSHIPGSDEDSAHGLRRRGGSTPASRPADKDAAQQGSRNGAARPPAGSNSPAAAGPDPRGVHRLQDAARSAPGRIGPRVQPHRGLVRAGPARRRAGGRTAGSAEPPSVSTELRPTRPPERKSASAQRQASTWASVSTPSTKRSPRRLRAARASAPNRATWTRYRAKHASSGRRSRMQPGADEAQLMTGDGQRHHAGRDGGVGQIVLEDLEDHRAGRDRAGSSPVRKAREGGEGLPPAGEDVGSDLGKRLEDGAGALGLADRWSLEEHLVAGEAKAAVEDGAAEQVCRVRRTGVGRPVVGCGAVVTLVPALVPIVVPLLELDSPASGHLVVRRDPSRPDAGVVRPAAGPEAPHGPPAEQFGVARPAIRPRKPTGWPRSRTRVTLSEMRTPAVSSGAFHRRPTRVGLPGRNLRSRCGCRRRGPPRCPGIRRRWRWASWSA